MSLKLIVFSLELLRNNSIQDGFLIKIASGLFLTYLVALIFVLELKTMNSLTFTEMTSGFVLVESMLGAYIW